MREVDVMRLLAGIGGAVTLIETLLGLNEFNERNYDASRIISIIIAIVLSVIVLFSVIRPGNPVPMNWLVFVILGLLILIFNFSLAGGILILLAGFIGYTER
jgi:hypothetical protein